ncbi:hypothetical protein O4H62_21950 [Hoeflea alexandrii]|nr:hypothetical protein [Hoeflea alexandrii]
MAGGVRFQAWAAAFCTIDQGAQSRNSFRQKSGKTMFIRRK